VGALRDVVVNHLIQLLGAAAMEAPSRGDPETLKDSQTTLFRSIVEGDPARYVRGQYDGYRAINGVAPDSTTETFAALRLEIENWRWSGVPIFIRAGKKLAMTQTELRLVFKTPPKLGFGLRSTTTEPDQLVIRIDPMVGIRLQLEAHHAGAGNIIQPIHLDMEFADQGGAGATPYEVLLHAAMTGQTLRFTRQDAVDEQWRIMQPLLDAPPPVEPYAPGTWGPEAAAKLLAGSAHWYEPWSR